jgi:hypothetical protein
VTNSSIEPNKGELGIVGQEPILRILPAAFGEYRSLFSIHLRRILEIEKKHPIHAVALLVAVACETLSKLLGQGDDEVFAARFLARRDVDKRVGRLIFQALRNGLAHRYRPYPITLYGEKVGLTMTWKGGQHLATVGVVSDGTHGHVVPVRPGQKRYICLDVSTMVADLNALFEEIAIQLHCDAKLRDEVVRRATDMFAKVGAEPQGDAAQAFDDFLSEREFKEGSGETTTEGYEEED